MQLPRRSFLPLLRACAPSPAQTRRADFRCLGAGVMPRIPVARARGPDSVCRARGGVDGILLLMRFALSPIELVGPSCCAQTGRLLRRSSPLRLGAYAPFPARILLAWFEYPCVSVLFLLQILSRALERIH